MSATRLLRRVTLTLTGAPPTLAQLQAIASADEAARAQIIDDTIAAALASPAFYDQLVTLGHDWIKVGRYSTGASGEAYWGHMSGVLETCAASTAMAGALYIVGDAPLSDTADGNANGVVDVCEGLAWDGSLAPATSEAREPWWAPGTSVTVVGRALSTLSEHAARDGNGTVSCGKYDGVYFTPGMFDDSETIADDTCGCGPNLVFCTPNGGGFAQNNDLDEKMQRRMAWDEPARLFAHLAWHDRDLNELVTGDVSVGPSALRHLYVRHARQNPANAARDAEDAWWRMEDAALADPHHEANDPMAWREFKQSDLHAHLLADRNYHYDPRGTTDDPLGIPSAGVLTMFGSQSSFARERPRAARWLEIFACKEFVPPPSTAQFTPFQIDPATSGTCQHCHALLDPAATYFKRWDFGGHYIGPTPMIPGIGPWKLPDDYTIDFFPYARWKQSWLPNTVLTPITQAELDANPYANIMDFRPEGTLLGVEGDGTIGPLGFGKILVESGALDQCATQRLAEHFLGRRLNPTTETGYLRALTRTFVDGGRRVRPFVNHLVHEASFGRGL